MFKKLKLYYNIILLLYINLYMLYYINIHKLKIKSKVVF